MQQLGITGIQVNDVSLDSVYIKVHPDGMGALKKAPLSPLGERKADGKFHMLSASDRGGVILALCPWNCDDAPEGRAFLRQLGLAGHPIGLMRGTRHRLWQWNLVIYQSFLQKVVSKILGTIINSTIRLSNSLVASSAFPVFSPAMINLILSF